MKRFNWALLVLPAFLFLSACDGGSSEDGEVVVTDMVVGDGEEVTRFQTLITTYVGTFTDGTQFDSTDEQGEDWIFTLGAGQVIEGWDENLEGMRVGGTRRLEIPSHKAFGRSGQCFSDGSCAVPPNTDVVYEVTIVDIFDEVQIEDVIEGDGDVAEFGDVLFVEYVGTLRNGQVFDASAIQGGEFVFTLGNGSVIEGWDRGLGGMKVGGKRRLTIPPILGYGAFGAGAAIPPFAILNFDVDLVDVVKRPTG